MLNSQRTLRSPRRTAPVRHHAAALPAHTVVAEGVSLSELVQFKSLMAAEREPVQVARMCYDRHYAFERIASAHACASDPLRRLALSLFQAYQRRDDTRHSSN